jgi:hypothetical protein
MPGSAWKLTLVALVKKTSLHFDCSETTDGLTRAGYITWRARAVVQSRRHCVFIKPVELYWTASPWVNILTRVELLSDRLSSQYKSRISLRTCSYRGTKNTWTCVFREVRSDFSVSSVSADTSYVSSHRRPNVHHYLKITAWPGNLLND